MAEYIEREAFLDYMKGTSRYFNVKFDIENFPAADAAPVVHGRWLTWAEKFPDKSSRKKNGLGVFCTICGNHADSQFDYCPNCGARMDGENDKV